VEWLRTLAFDVLDLRDLTLVGQDWGGLLGLRLVADFGEKFARVVCANTGLPTGDNPMPDVWLRFRDMVAATPEIDISRLIASGCVNPLSAEVRAAYDAPFPGPEYQAGPKAMPRLVPTTPDDPASEPNRAAWQKLAQWRKPFLVAFSDSDPITGGMAPIFTQFVPGTAGIDHPVLTGAGHFLQEDAGERLAQEIVRFIASA
jgi:haloalkane dehalogenase